MKLLHVSISLILCTTLSVVPSAPAKDKMLWGRVFPEIKADLDGWCVQVSPLLLGNSAAEPSYSSSGDHYFHEAKENTEVSFIFSTDFYQTTQSPWVPVSPDLSHPYPVVPEITLYKIRPSPQARALLRQPLNSEAVFSTVSYDRQGAEELRKARESLRNELVQQAQLARISRTTDIFQFNLEVYGDVYRNQHEELKSDITRFKSEDTFKDVTRAAPGRAELYRKMVLNARGEKVDIDPESLYQVASDPKTSTSLRIRSVRTMGVNSRSASDEKTINFLRATSRDRSSQLQLPSLTQLIKVGTDQDRQEIVKDLEGSDLRRVSSILTAIEGAQWKEGKTAATKLSTAQSVQPAIKERARQTVQKLDRLESGDDQAFEAGPGRERQMIQLSGLLKGTPAEFRFTPQEGGSTGIEVLFRNLPFVKGIRVYVLWAVGRNQNVKLGQIVNRLNPRPARIQAETSLTRFDLLLTAEGTETSTKPSGAIVARIKR